MTNKQKGFWPLPGGIRNYVNTLSEILSIIKENKPSEKKLIDWLIQKYSLKNKKPAKSYINAVIKKTGLIDIREGKFVLNNFGEEFLKTKNNLIILKLFIKNIFGFEEILKLLAKKQILDIKEIWKKIENVYHTGWKTDAQIRWRVYWLLSLEYVDVTSNKYYLTEKGIAALNEILKIKISENKIPKKEIKKKLEKISHSDLEDKMKYIGDFFEFEAIEKPRVNIMLPPERQLKSFNKELDGLWIKKIPMGGKIYYPIEIQISGNLSDTIDRLETISDFAQKVIVVVDEKQEEIMLERLKAKRSKLLDKIVFIRPEDVYKMVSATNALKGFFEKLFSH